jgi:DNA-binding SARP family transcriptional activator
MKVLPEPVGIDEDVVLMWLGPALTALIITDRPFLPDDEAPWIDERRAWLRDARIRALECYAAAALGAGGTELSAAVRAARGLIREAPLRELGHQILMHALAAQGNVGEALLVHARLVSLLRDELGIGPSAQSEEVYRELLRG